MNHSETAGAVRDPDGSCIQGDHDFCPDCDRCTSWDGEFCRDCGREWGAA